MAKTKVKLPRKHQARFEYSLEQNEFFNPEALLRPPLFRAAYSDRTSWLMAKAAKLAYIRFEDSDENLDLLQDRLAEGGFTLLYIFSSGGTEAYLAANPKMAILAFRGTEKNDWRDIWNDLRVRFYKAGTTERRKGKIHTGFNAAYGAIANELEEALEEVKDRPVYITGHSLGGAVATVAARENKHDNIAAVYTFGCPRVGCGDFEGDLKSPVYRVVNRSDLVTQIPMMFLGYRHAGYLIFIRGDGRISQSAGWLRRIPPFWFYGLFTLLIKPIRDHRIDTYIRDLSGYAMRRTSDPQLQGALADNLLQTAERDGGVEEFDGTVEKETT